MGRGRATPTDPSEPIRDARLLGRPEIAPGNPIAPDALRFIWRDQLLPTDGIVKATADASLKRQG